MPDRPTTCFVISPIGEEGSEVNRDANDFLELLVEPALEKFDITVVRADRLASPNAITTDIVRLVQESELCVVDLTHLNPNVLYECGRRHESGKPCIQMIQKSRLSELPFDVAGIRTIPYDLSLPRDVKTAQDTLKEFVAGFVEGGFDSTTSGESLTSIAHGIERVERKVAQVLGRLSGDRSGIASGAKVDSIEMALMPPSRLFRESITNGRIDQALAVLPRLRKANGYSEYIGATGILAAMGVEQAFSMVEEELDKFVNKSDEITESVGQSLVTAAGTFFQNMGRLQDGISYLKAVYERLVQADHSGDTLGCSANRIGMLAWIVDDHETCIYYTKKAIQHNPEPAYYYNLALVYRATDDTTALNETLMTLARLPDLDEDHLMLLEKFGFEAHLTPATEA